MAGESEGREGVERGGGLLLVVEEESPLFQCIVSRGSWWRGVGEGIACAWSVAVSQPINRRALSIRLRGVFGDAALAKAQARPTAVKESSQLSAADSNGNP